MLSCSSMNVTLQDFLGKLDGKPETAAQSLNNIHET